jgi:hypothetical protein
MGFYKNMFMVFLNSELPLPRNARKRAKKKVKKEYLGLVGSSKVNQIYAGVRQFFFGVPLEKRGAVSFLLSARRTALSNFLS